MGLYDDSLPISELVDADPLLGGELLAVVQDGQTRKTTASNFTGLTTLSNGIIPQLSIVTSDVWTALANFTVPAGKKYTLDLSLPAICGVSAGAGSFVARIFVPATGLDFATSYISLGFADDVSMLLSSVIGKMIWAYDNTFGSSFDIEVQVVRHDIFPPVTWATSFIRSDILFGYATYREIIFG